MASEGGKEKEEGWRESIGKRLGEVEGGGNCFQGVEIKRRKSQMSMEGRGRTADQRRGRSAES